MNWNRILSSVVAIGYLAAAYFIGGGEAVLRVALCLLLPLACIWFSQAMGDYTGTIRGHLVTQRTPAGIVRAGGWLLLLLPVLIGLVWALRSLWSR